MKNFIQSKIVEITIAAGVWTTLVWLIVNN